MPRKSVRVFLSPEAVLRIQFVARTQDVTFSQALEMLVHRGYERRKKEESA